MLLTVIQEMISQKLFGNIQMGIFSAYLFILHPKVLVSIPASGRSVIDISKDEIKAAKIAHHYTKFNLLYKNLKTNQNPKFFYCKNSSVGIFPNDTICQNKLQNF